MKVRERRERREREARQERSKADLETDHAGAFSLDPGLVFLNHGSFGACPVEVQAQQSRLRARMERDPIEFLARDLEGLLDEARVALAAFLDADPEGLAFVPNATTGVATVLASLRLEPGDELLSTQHGYNACRNALARTAEAAGARLVVAEVPFPVADPEEVTRAVLAAVTPRTRFALVDHVTSPTALVFPVEAMVAALAARGVAVMIDGAHAPGMVDLSIGRLASLGASYYAGNCHKWLCAPKGAGFLWVRGERRAAVRPLVTSHGATAERPERSRFRLEHDWTGTFDPTAYLCVPEAIRVVGGLCPGGWPALRDRGRRLALAARELLGRALGVTPPAPESMIGTMASLPLPDAAVASPRDADPLMLALYRRHRIEVPVIPWPSPLRRLLRVSAAPHNRLAHYQALVTALASEPLA